MFKNYVTVALRNLWKNKAFSIINIIGLSIGISAALVIYLIVQYDFSFDKFEKDKDRIYRVVTNIDMAGTPYITSGVATPLGDAVKAELPGLDIIAKFHMFYGSPNVTIPQTTKKSLPTFKNQEGVIFADSEYFKLLCYKWVAGSPQTALTKPFTVVLTEKQAKVFFPGEKISSIIGKQVIYDDSIKVFVSGIVEDILPNTDFNFQQFLSLATIASSGIKQYYGLTSWGSTNSGTQLWLKLVYGNTPAKVEAGLKTVFKKYYFINRHHDDKGTNFKLQPLSDLHFNDTYGTFNNRTAHKPTLYGLLAVAAFLLLLGCINFINLTTAQSSQRAKEIGIRKTMGGTRQQLMFQFLTETFFITIIASLLAVAATPVLMNIFGDFIPTELHFSLSNQQGIIIFLIGLIISVGMLSGLYPAFFLSKFNPVLVLKNQAYKGTASTRRAWVRKSLTVFQFFIAQVFIMATIVTVKQINFMINSDLGFKKDAIINFYTPYKHSNAKTPPNTQLVLLNQLKTMPGIQMVSLSRPPASQGFGSGTMSFKDGNKVIETDVQEAQGDTNFFRLYNIKLLAGRCALPQDSLHEYVINETYMHILGFEKPQDVLNKRIGRSLIVGVMNDFHQQSLHERIAPLVFSVEKLPSTNFSVALSPQTPRGNTWSATIHNIEVAYKKLYPESTFNYSFFDESIAKFYKSEQDISRLLKWATGLAVFISCMGLLGLVMYTTNQRRKEISIRKVMGATVTHIVSILSRDFTRLVVIAFVIATPVVWWLMHAWLENFAYRTNISWWIFLISGVIMVLLALLTLSIQTIKAATANPVKSLKEE